MANPQKEEGYTSIANAILEALCYSNLSARELRIILCIIRFTYGFHEKEKQLSLSFIEKQTGIKKAHISETLKQLEKCHIITILKNKGITPQTISFQKNYEKWRVTETVTVPKKVTVGLPLGVTVVLPTGVTNKENTKENTKENIYIEHLPDWFEEVWAAYPNKKGKKNISKKCYKEIEAAGKEKLLKCIENIKAFKEKNTWYSYQHGSTFFNGGWKDYVEPEEEEVSKEECEEKWQ